MMVNHQQEGVIVAEELTKAFGEKTVVDRVSFAVKRGDIFGFLGPNGSGKSTMIRMLCGLIAPSNGKGYVERWDSSSDSLQIRRSIGYMSQKFGLYADLTVKQNLEFYGQIYGVNWNDLAKRIDELSAKMRLGPYLNHKAAHLSGGWKQRLALACALLHRPSVLFLDEPTAGIDPVARREVWDLLFELSAQNITLFVTTHYMDEAERCHDLGYIYLGKLIAHGSVEELVNMPNLYPADHYQLEVIGEPIMQIYSLLGRMKEIKQVTIFGTSLHFVAPRQLTTEAIDRAIREHTACKEPLVRPSKPSLEDVFVVLTKKQSANQEKQ